MCRGWKGLALLATFGGLCMPLQAQVSGTYPSAVGAARMPQPIPTDPSTAPPPYEPNLIPGPVSPLAAPMGPPDALSLPADHSSAFQLENYVTGDGFYVNVGPMALQRNHLGAGDIAVVNASTQGMAPPSLPDPFLPTPAGTASALNFNSVTPALSMGIRGTVGYLWGENQAIELSSFYIFQDNVNAVASQPGALDTLFYNPPLTFLGQGLFRRDNMVELTQGSNLFNVELNYRRWNSAFRGLEFIAGLRYVGQNDFLGITMSGSAPILNSYGMAPGQDGGIYQVTCNNHILAPQLGMEYNLPVFRWLTLSGMGKGAWGANYLTSDVNLSRQDGLIGFNSQRNATVFAQVYEMGAFADINLLEKLRLRLGYTATWLTGVAASVDQVNFNLLGYQAEQAYGAAGLTNALKSGNMNAINNAQAPIQRGHVDNNGSILYFGPQIELQFFF